jgi:hypothetical protein
MVTLRNELLVQVREFIRQPLAWPGCYPKVLLMADGEVMCAVCAKANYRLISQATRSNDRRDSWCVAGVDLFLEGSPLSCAHCNKPIESAYGEPENE